MEDHEAFKSEVDGKTLIARYLRKQGPNQIFNYNESKLVIRAIVENKSHRLCWLPEQTQALCSKFGLSIAQTQSLKVCRDYDVLCDTLYGAYIDIKVSKGLQDKSVNIMLVKREDNSSGDYVLSISKFVQEDFQLLKEVFETLSGYVRDCQMISVGKAEVLAD